MNQLEREEVVVVDVEMRFWSMVGFMVKWAFATMPALIILIVIVIGGVVVAVVNGIGSGMA